MKKSKLKFETRSIIRMHRRLGFTLIEILVATIILGLGLVGIAAIFPAVISQQQNSNDLSQALSASASGEGLLNSQLTNFGSAIQDPEYGLPADAGWVRINAYDPYLQDVEPYLQAPSQGIIDLRLKVREYGFKVNASDGQLNDPYMHYSNIKLPSDTTPIAVKDHRLIAVNFVIDNGSMPTLIKLQPRDDNPNLFRVVKGGADRMDSSPLSNRPNKIDYDNATMSFHVKLNVNETINKVTIDYAWRNDKIISHSDRMFPSENPRYAWDIAVRKGFNGNPQYSMFVYKFEGGPRDSHYYPDIPSRWLSQNEGMLRDGSATIVYDTKLKKAYLINLSTEMKNAVTSGIYVLPRDSASPVKILRKVDDNGNDKWELQAPPMQILDDGSVTFYQNNSLIEHIYYLPLEVPAYDGDGNVIGTYKIKPLIAISKQFST